MKDSTGRWLTRGLFVELADPELVEKYPPIFTLADARKVYIECEDITEYTVAMVLLGNWDHWVYLCKNPTVLIHIKKWREELEVLIRSKAIKNIQHLSEGEKGFSAARFLADRGWEKKVGRPTRAQIARNAKLEASLESDLSQDASRVNSQKEDRKQPCH